MARIGSSFFTVLGAAFAVAGADKIIGNRGYARMFDHLGWSRGGLRAVALAEMAGGALLAAGSTRRLGGAIAVALTLVGSLIVAILFMAFGLGTLGYVQAGGGGR